MSLLIDGYNLLHATGIFGRGPASFQRSREALLDFLAVAVDPNDLPRTTVVFDARDAPPGLPRVLKHSGLTVQYASDYESADDLLEELIRADHSPRKLTVVSSDHRVQRAAKRRKATAVDSDCWYAERVRQLHSGGERSVVSEAKPAAPLSNVEVQWWLDHFHAPHADAALSAASAPAEPAAPAESPRPAASRRPKPPSKGDATPRHLPPLPEDLRNPFPPGYVADVMRELGEE